MQRRRSDSLCALLPGEAATRRGTCTRRSGRRSGRARRSDVLGQWRAVAVRVYFPVAYAIIPRLGAALDLRFSQPGNLTRAPQGR